MTVTTVVVEANFSFVVAVAALCYGMSVRFEHVPQPVNQLLLFQCKDLLPDPVFVNFVNSLRAQVFLRFADPRVCFCNQTFDLYVTVGVPIFLLN